MFNKTLNKSRVSKKYQYLIPWKPHKNAKIPSIQVVTCFLQKDDRILVLQRARKDLQYKLWGIPGGKLNEGELPLSGLIREIKEETGLDLSQNAFRLLGTAISRTPCDGEYGLYLYHVVLSEHTQIQIHNPEHYAYRWVTLDEFKSLDLLTAQGEAFDLVEKQLNKFMTQNPRDKQGGKYVKENKSRT